MRAVISYAQGSEHLKLAELTWPLMRRYASHCKASWVPYTEVPAIDRPPAWKKLVCLAHALSEFDEVLWLDSDVVVADHDDIFEDFPDGKIHAIVEHKTDEGSVPNTGVWLCRRGILPWLAVAAMRDECVHHKWWEQAAILHLLGYSVQDGQCSRHQETSLYLATHWLDERWNYCSHSKGDVVSFVHPCGAVGDARLESIKGVINACYDSV